MAARRVTTTTLVSYVRGGFTTRFLAGVPRHSRTGSRLALVAVAGLPHIVSIP